VAVVVADGLQVFLKIVRDTHRENGMYGIVQAVAVMLPRRLRALPYVLIAMMLVKFGQKLVIHMRLRLMPVM